MSSDPESLGKAPTPTVQHAGLPPRELPDPSAGLVSPATVLDPQPVTVSDKIHEIKDNVVQVADKVGANIEDVAKRVGERGKVAAARAAKVGAAVAGRVGEATGVVAKKAAAELSGPEAMSLDGLLAASDLPALAGTDTLATLAKRLDQESDFWRDLALRALTRLSWADRIAHVVATLAAVGAAALGGVGALGALFGGGETAGGRAILILSAMAVLAAGALLVSWTSIGIRKSQREVVNTAVAHADAAEKRLRRVAVALSLAKSNPDGVSQILLTLDDER